jgi:hypothetical protein
MKKATKSVIAISVVFNIYYLIAWIYSYNKNGTHELRVAGFSDFFPPAFNTMAITAIAIILSLISAIALLASREFNMPWRPILLFIQIVFLLFYIWQLL